MNTASKSFYGEDFLKYLENTYGQNGRYNCKLPEFFLQIQHLHWSLSFKDMWTENQLGRDWSYISFCLQ